MTNPVRAQCLLAWQTFFTSHGASLELALKSPKLLDSEKRKVQVACRDKVPLEV
jgi:hypothetical protein